MNEILGLWDSKLPVEDLRSDIAVSLGLVPGLADDAAVGSAQESGFIQLIVVGNAGSGGRCDHFGHTHSRLKKQQASITNFRCRVRKWLKLTTFSQISLAAATATTNRRKNFIFFRDLACLSCRKPDNVQTIRLC